MSSDSQEAKRSRGKESVGIIVLLLALVALFAPAYIVFSSFLTTMIGMTWMLGTIGGETFFALEPAIFLVNLPYTLLRLPFVMAVYYYYKGVSPKRHTLVVGVLSELQALIFLGTARAGRYR